MSSPDRWLHHIKTLANDNQVSMTLLDQSVKHAWRYAEAFVQAREVLVPYPRLPEDYLIALHELGHVLSHDADRLEHRSGTEAHLTREAAAWAWAADQALAVPPEAWNTVLRDSLVGHFLDRVPWYLEASTQEPAT